MNDELINLSNLNSYDKRTIKFKFLQQKANAKGILYIYNFFCSFIIYQILLCIFTRGIIMILTTYVVLNIWLLFPSNVLLTTLQADLLILALDFLYSLKNEASGNFFLLSFRVCVVYVLIKKNLHLFIFRFCMIEVC